MRDVDLPGPAPVPSGDAKFTEIYSRYGKHVQAYCARRIDRSHVADAVAETFLVAWKRLDQIDDVDAALPWLYGTAYRVICHRWRRESRERTLARYMRNVVIVEVEPADAIARGQEQTDLVLLAISRLKAIDQEVLRLELWEELSHAEVAVALDISPEAARQRASRARRNLAQEYEKLVWNRRPGQMGGGVA